MSYSVFLPYFCEKIMMDPDGMNRFSEIIVAWYKENKRDLPWRDTKDPYRIWVSEIILQQTRVAQGTDYYRRFVTRFPDVFALAAAKEDDVLKCWQGLGYYSRARHLHAAAKTIAGRGSFPTTYKEVRALKGVGEYTAAAICSFAYDLPYAAVDGNVYRVLSRWLGIDTPVDTVAGKKLIAAAAEELMDRRCPGLYNQAIMDFGALQCTPAAPDCLFCPLMDSCAAHRDGTVNALPVKQHKTKLVNRYFNYIYVRMGRHTFIHKREADDIWKNLYELPLVETDRALAEEEFYALPAFRELLAKDETFQIRPVCRGMKQVLSHRVIYADFYEVILPENSASFAHFKKICASDLHKFAVSRLVNRFFSLILSPD